MKFSSQFRNFVLSWKSCFASMRHAKIFLPFIIYAGLQIGFIVMLMFFAYPPFAAFFAPIIMKLFGEPALHYPNNFLVLPSLFFWVNLLLSGLLGILLIGATTRLFSSTYRAKSVSLGDGLRGTFPDYALLLLVWIVETACLLAVFMGVPRLLGKIAFLANRGALPIQLLTSLAAIVVGALFVYTTALIVLEKAGPIRAIARSLSLFAKYPVITILLIAIPNFIRMPIDLLSGKTQFLITKFNPEIVAGVLIMSVLLSIFTNYFLVGTVTGYFLMAKDKGMPISA